MKRILSTLLVLSMLLSYSAAMAELGVQIIGGPDMESEPVSLDDVKVGDVVDIDGYATIEFKEYVVKDKLGYYFAGKNAPYGNYPNYYYQSGSDAEFIALFVDLTNLSTKDKNFLTECEVQVIFDDKYIYGGWAFQQNYNNNSANGWYDNETGADRNEQNKKWVIDSSDVFAVGQMYTGHYVFGCTLPNAVINSKKPLRMVITLDGNEITYNIRK